MWEELPDRARNEPGWAVTAPTATVAVVGQ
jgi:hypothetical protein